MHHGSVSSGRTETHERIDLIGPDAPTVEESAEPLDHGRPEIVDQVEQVRERPLRLQERTGRAATSA